MRAEKDEKVFGCVPCVLCVSGEASAQSNGVVLYGIADVGIEYANKQPGAGSSVVRETAGNLSGSRWGLRGVEELGSGLKAIFVLESGFDLDTGKSGQNSRLFGRQAFVGLQNQYGSLTMGRHLTPFFDFGGVYDPMLISTKYSVFGQDLFFVSRADNSIKYTCTFGPLSATAFYSFGVDSTVTGGSEVPGVAKIGREISTSVSYSAGPASIGAIFDQVSTGTVTSNPDAKVRRASLAATVDVASARVFAGYRWAKAYDGAVLTGAAAGADNQSSGLFWAGVRYAVTPAFTVSGAAYYQKFKNSSANPWLLSLLADYNLSKRTDVYTAIGYTLNRHGSDLGLSNGSSGFDQTLPGANQFGVTAGVRHRF